jgi:Ser-tRNA(Ala) deacylase AlaX
MTKLLYLQDTYLFESTASILKIETDDMWKYIVLDQTIFYPQWWGQPSDSWEISLWENNFHITKCKLSPDGVVHHYGTYSNWELHVWDSVYLTVDSEVRFLNARNHSAWHLLDVAIHELWYSESLAPTKWYHFSQGAYVEYEWEFDELPEMFISQIEKKMNELIEQNISISIKYEGLWDLEAPQWKTPRYVYFEWYTWCGCWGTHVKKSWEIGWVSLRKVKYKKWVLRVSYEVGN